MQRVEDAVDVREPPLPHAAHDAQDACHGALPRREDRADQQVLGVSPRAVDEQRCERQDDPGEAGGQGERGGVSWRGRHQPIHHACFGTSAHSTSRKWPKSSLGTHFYMREPQSDHQGAISNTLSVTAAAKLKFSVCRVDFDTVDKQVNVVVGRNFDRPILRNGEIEKNKKLAHREIVCTIQ